MLNLGVASRVAIDGRDGVEAAIGARGNLLYGPYETLAAGRYAVEFAVTLLSGDASHDVAAIIDVVADMGKRVIAFDYVSSAHIRSGEAIILPFDLPEPTQVEYRLSSTGRAHLAVADLPRLSVRHHDEPAETRFCAHGTDQLAIKRGEPLRRLEDILQDSNGVPAKDGIGLGETLANALRPFRPQRVLGFDKVRIGGDSDGGYVCLDDFEGIDAVFSFGIDHNVDFDDAMAARGAHIHQFDHTVDDPRPDDPCMTFEKKMISVYAGEGVQTLPSLVDRYDKGLPRPNLLLKIDIENYEWPVFDEVPVDKLVRVRQIIGEIHAFEFFVYPQWRERALRVLKKLSDHFALVHVHANNCAGTTVFDGVIMPNVLEVTLINRSCYNLIGSDEVFPSLLDRPCSLSSPEIMLGRFDF